MSANRSRGCFYVKRVSRDTTKVFYWFSNAQWVTAVSMVLTYCAVEARNVHKPFEVRKKGSVECD